jgi:hypothetical protein
MCCPDQGLRRLTAIKKQELGTIGASAKEPFLVTG